MIANVFNFWSNPLEISFLVKISSKIKTWLFYYQAARELFTLCRILAVLSLVHYISQCALFTVHRQCTPQHSHSLLMLGSTTCLDVHSGWWRMSTCLVHAWYPGFVARVRYQVPIDGRPSCFPNQRRYTLLVVAVVYRYYSVIQN